MTNLLLLMMETSTPISKSLLTDQSSHESPPQELSEEDQLFHQTISADLNNIEMKPSAKTVKAILNYSKSL